MRSITAIILIFVIYTATAYSQCGCPGDAGASVGGITPIGGTTNVGIVLNKAFRFMLFYNYGYANEYYKGDSKAIPGSIKSFSSHYMGLMVAYGLTKEFTLETELGYFPDKTQVVYLIDKETGSKTGKGLSHLSLYGKYNIISTYENDFEWTAGVGIKAPLHKADSILPLHVQVSTGAFGAIALSYLHKKIDLADIHLFLVNRFEINAENSIKYTYGNAFYTSFFVTRSITDNLMGILELRNEYRAKDIYLGNKINPESGGTVFTIAPQLNYRMGNFNISAMFNYPFYKYYNDSQLAQKYSALVNLSYTLETRDRNLFSY